jgi:hypothetical protein
MAGDSNSTGTRNKKRASPVLNIFQLKTNNPESVFWKKLARRRNHVPIQTIHDPT